MWLFHCRRSRLSGEWTCLGERDAKHRSYSGTSVMRHYELLGSAVEVKQSKCRRDHLGLGPRYP